MPHAVLIVCGGPSREHDVSISSARAILRHIDRTAFQVTLGYLDHQLGLHLIPDPDPEGELPSSSAPTLFHQLADLKKYDTLLLTTHGEFGEDGTLQGILESHGITFTGSDSFSSKLCMDKYRSGQVVAHLSPIRIPATRLYTTRQLLQQDAANLPLPAFLKPNRAGSSVGCFVMQTAADYLAAREQLQTFGQDHQWVLQERLHGIEVTCGVLERRHHAPQALPPTEIIPQRGEFFDFTSKYEVGGSLELTPPEHISPELCSRIQTVAVQIHRELGCRLISRSDFLVQGEDLYYFETNTLPGMTATSLIPQAAAVAGMNFSQLISFLVLESLAA